MRAEQALVASYLCVNRSSWLAEAAAIVAAMVTSATTEVEQEAAFVARLAYPNLSA